MRQPFPFAAIAGQEQLKLALLLNAIDASIGGVLICGDKGTAKSTAARALAQLLPTIDKNIGCSFNCLPAEPMDICLICNDGTSQIKNQSAPFVNLPLGSTEDRVIGSLDFEQALKAGKRAFQPGLLASAHRGVLFIDEVNLLADHLVDILLDVAAMGVNVIQREGLSIEHLSRFCLIGTMNFEEGELRPQFLDRFGLMVEVNAPKEPSLRTEVVKRRLAFEADTNEFIHSWHNEQETLKENIIFAQNYLSKVVVKDEHLELISKLCCELNVISLRADIVMYKVIRALAALNKRPTSSLEDIKEAAALVLPHRRRNKPGEQSGLNNELLDKKLDELSNDNEQNSPDTSDTTDGEQIYSIADNAAIKKLDIISQPDQNTQAESGRRTITNDPAGHYVRSKAATDSSNLSVIGTIQHSVMRNGGTLKVEKEDWQEKVQQKKSGTLVIFVIDSSSSMAAVKRMSLVKGCVAKLLKDAYKNRDQIAVITFRGTKAEILLAPGKNTDQALRQLEQLPTGGRSPLPHALMLAKEMLERNHITKHLQPSLIILTDGKANVAINTENDPWQETMNIAQQLKEKNIPAMVIDTEADFIRLGKARELATAIQADYAAIDDMSAETLLLRIKNGSPILSRK